MRAYTIDISSWTASFRYPNLISGFQPTLEVPPLSTILGLINAAAGQYLYHQRMRFGYYFEFASKAIDLETVYQVEGNKGHPTNNVKPNVIRREFLYDNRLRLYLEDPAIADYFRQPVFPLLMGRMNDLASVEYVSEDAIELPVQANAQCVRGQVVPFLPHRLPGVLQALPTYFTDELPRRNLGTEPFSVISYHSGDFPTQLTAFHDASIGKCGIDIYIHEVDSSDFRI